MPGRVFKRNEVYWIAFYCRGKEYRASTKTAKKRKAEELLAFYLGQVARGEFQGFQQEKGLTLSDLFTLVLDDAEIRELRDVYHMRFRAAHLQQFFGAETPVEAITEAAIARYVAARRKQGRQLSTVNRELAVLRQALRLARKRRLVKDVPDMERFPEHNVRLVFFEPDVYEAVLPHLSEVLQDVVRFAYLTGWRRGQIVRLVWHDVHPGVIRLSGITVKHKDIQVLSLTGELAEIIARRQRARHPDAPWVFHRDGQLIRDFRAAWKQALARARVSDYHFHDFRRTATRNMALAGVPEKHIMQVTGHKTRHMIDRYNITVERDTENTLAQTQAYLARQRQTKHGQDTDTGKMTGK
jgi:integrase